MRVEQHRQNKIVRLPRLRSRRVTRAASQLDQSLARKSVDRFPPSTLLDSEHSKLLEVERTAIRRWQIRLLGQRNAAAKSEGGGGNAEQTRFQIADNLTR